MKLSRSDRVPAHHHSSAIAPFTGVNSPPDEKKRLSELKRWMPETLPCRCGRSLLESTAGLKMGALPGLVYNGRSWSYRMNHAI
ncbi:MAG: hypothetical protein KME42_05850 [Tildeniella nuda ZEHNDER 1965/U140]|nr:hypothetical protein [Tildeniella nuda ZEHNDER 1965/U140]